jgi:hypothetical protein
MDPDAVFDAPDEDELFDIQGGSAMDSEEEGQHDSDVAMTDMASRSTGEDEEDLFFGDPVMVCERASFGSDRLIDVSFWPQDSRYRAMVNSPDVRIRTQATSS